MYFACRGGGCWGLEQGARRVPVNQKLNVCAHLRCKEVDERKMPTTIAG